MEWAMSARREERIRTTSCQRTVSPTRHRLDPAVDYWLYFESDFQ